MKRPLIFLITFFVLNNVFAAERLIDLYQQFIPQQIKRQKRYMEIENKKLERYAELNPDLIYVYLEHLNRKFNLRLSDPDSNFHNYFGYLLNTSKEKKSKWAHKIQLQIDKRAIIPLAKAKLIYLFSTAASIDYKIELQEKEITPPKDFDRNRQAYFKYIYFSKDDKEEYDPQKNYTELCDQQLEKIAARFTKYYNELELIGESERKNLIAKALKYSFLFKESYLPAYERTNFSILDFIYKAIIPEYRNYFGLSAGISYTPLKVSFDDAISFADPAGKMYSVAIKASYNTYVRFGFRFVLNKKMIPFSYINATFGFGLSAAPKNKEDKNLGHIILYDGDLYVNGAYGVRNLRSFDMYSFMVQFSTPALFITDKLYFEGGLNYTFYYLKFKYDYYFDGYAIDHSNNGLPDFYKGWTKEVKENKHRFRPLLVANYNLTRFINLRLDILVYNDFQVGINYVYRF